MKVIQVIPKLDLAGAEIMCENLALALNKKNVDAVVVSLYNHHTVITERLQKKGIKVIYLDKKPGMDISIINALYRVFKNEKPDVVHTHINVLQYVAVACYMARVKKLVHTVHSIASKEATPLKQKIYYFLFKSKKIVPVALSAEVKKSIVERYKLSEERVPIVYNGIDLDRCIPKSNYMPNEELIFLHVGRFADVKNHPMLIDAFSELVKMRPDVKLWLVGDGPNIDMIKGKVSELRLEEHVEFWGLQPDVFKFFEEADVFVLPSIYEGMPMTLIEAMGSGMPIIASDVGGIPSMLNNDKNALLTDVNEKSLLNAMIKMTDPFIRERLGKAAKMKSIDFSSNTMAENYIKIYNS